MTLDRFRLDGPPRWGAMLAALCASLGLGLVGVSDRLERLARGPEAAAGFKLLTPSGSPTIARNEPVTLAALVVPARPGGEVPAAAELLIRTGSQLSHAPMTAAGPGAFTAVVPAAQAGEGFDYAVEAGFARSAWRRVRVADPVALVGCRVELRPADYAAGVALPARDSWGDLVGIAGCEARLVLHFDRPPAQVGLELAGPGGAAAPVAVDQDGDVARASFPLPPDATLTLTAVAGYGLRTSYTLHISTLPDAPPTLVLDGGVPAAAFRARPGDAALLRFTAGDDLRLRRVLLEVEGGPARVVATAAGAAAVEVPLEGPAGSVVRFRLAAGDVAGQSTSLPATGWFAATLDPAAAPVGEQAVHAEAGRRRGDLRERAERLAAAAGQLRAALADPDAGPIAPEANAALHAASGLCAGDCGAARALAVRAAEADGGRHALIRMALVELAAAQAATDAELADCPRATDLRLAAASLRHLARDARRGALAPAAARDRLVGLLATRPGLGEALNHAEALASAESARHLAALKAELDALERSATAWPGRRRAACADEAGTVQRALAGRAAALAGRTARAARVAGAPPLDPEPFGRAASELAAGRLLDAAVTQETAAAAADKLATRFAAAADARADRREALRQLARWGELELGDAGRVALRAAVAEIDPGLEPTPEALRRAADALPPLAERRKAALARVEGLRRALDAGALPSLAGELARLDANGWPAAPDAAVLALARAAATRHPGDVQFARAALARLAGALAGEVVLDAGELAARLRNPGRDAARLAAESLAVADAARAFSPASAERVAREAEALARATRRGETPATERLADALAALARRQYGGEPAADARRRLDAWDAETLADARRQRLVAAERALTPPADFARFVGPPRPLDADTLPALGGDALPGRDAAGALRALAADQRRARDAAVAALIEANRPPAVRDGDPLLRVSDDLTRHAASSPAQRLALLEAARLARAGDGTALAASLARLGVAVPQRFDLLDEWTRAARRAAEWAAEMRHLARELSGPAAELARDAATFVGNPTPVKLIEAGFRIDAARAHLPAHPQFKSRPGDYDLTRAGQLIRQQLGGVNPAELDDAADALDRAAEGK